MESPLALNDQQLASAWANAQTQTGQQATLPVADPERLAFADPEFLLRRETRGIRIQLELMKPDISQQQQGVDNTIVVFGSARYKSLEDAQKMLQDAQASGNATALKHAQTMLRNAPHYEKARELGQLIAQYSATKEAKDKLFVCTGGGPGIMEAANRGVFEAGGQSVGLSIALPKEERPNRYITPSLTFKFHYFAVRKMHFMMRAVALIAFPGGFGTLDELFETLTLVQCKKAKPVPIILFGTDYWKRLMNLEVLVEEGAISPEDMDLFQYADEPQDALNKVLDFYQLRQASSSA